MSAFGFVAPIWFLEDGPFTRYGAEGLFGSERQGSRIQGLVSPSSTWKPERGPLKDSCPFKRVRLFSMFAWGWGELYIGFQFSFGMRATRFEAFASRLWWGLSVPVVGTEQDNGQRN